mmetsp:Transcript_28070/g.97118  ORF Transcript_28070/g.97118 Transcript_28070/m.97118 type:complete len:240 (+) Transcript_28070:931-1650(+)
MCSEMGPRYTCTMDGLHTRSTPATLSCDGVALPTLRLCRLTGGLLKWFTPLMLRRPASGRSVSGMVPTTVSAYGDARPSKPMMAAGCMSSALRIWLNAVAFTICSLMPSTVRLSFACEPCGVYLTVWFLACTKPATKPSDVTSLTTQSARLMSIEMLKGIWMTAESSPDSAGGALKSFLSNRKLMKVGARSEICIELLPLNTVPMVNDLTASSIHRGVVLLPFFTARPWQVTWLSTPVT